MFRRLRRHPSLASLDYLACLLGKGSAHGKCERDAMSLNLMRPYRHRPRRPVRCDHDIDPSILGILAETPSSRVRDSRRVRLADGSHLFVRGREALWRPPDHDYFTENFTSSHHRPRYWLCTHRDTQSSYWQKNEADDA